MGGRAASQSIGGFRPLEANYGNRLLRLIDENQLDQFDLAQLAGAGTVIAVN